ncbi:hypothetical protein C8Q77DRAFT_1158058 [Trametes polyzona]|nr:hypothetical protein C8Q77DRAFT_1158058 [Trametes polyzona]
MSGLPPQLDTQPGTPANEWARSTTTAAFSRTEPAPAFSVTNDNTSIPQPSSGVSVSAANDAQKPPFDPKTYNVAPSTPSEIPGAYPTTPGEQAAKPQIPISADTVKETAQSAAATASTLVQSAAETAAQYLPKGVVDTVSSYIPTSSATATMNTARASEHDAEHTTSFPTREFSGASSGERTGGVGSLPGPLNEPAVTKLPDERAEEERYMTAGAAAAALAGGAYALKDRVAGSVPSAQDAQAVKETAQEKVHQTAQTVKQAAPPIPGVTTTHTTAVTSSTVPSRELFGAQPGEHSSGAGALPGYQDEAHVARLPEESARPQYDSGPVDNAAQIALKPSEEKTGNEAAVGEMRHVGGVGALVGGRDESSVALAPDERAGYNASSAVGGASRTLPSQEASGNDSARTPRHVGGVGALVGGRDEQGAAVLPDERTQQQGTGTGTVTQPKMEQAPAVPPKEDNGGDKNLKNVKGGHHGQPNKGEHDLPGDPGTGQFARTQSRSPPGGVDEHGKPRETQADLLHATLRPRAHALGAERAHWGNVPLNGASAREELARDFDGPNREPPNDHRHPDAAGEGPGYDTDYHPAELHPRSDAPANPASAGEKSLGATQADAQRPPEQARPPHQAASTGSGASGGGEKAKKAGFMDKMKGEAKVLLGKIEHKQEKVEEGQRLKAGEA